MAVRKPLIPNLATDKLTQSIVRAICKKLERT